MKSEELLKDFTEFCQKHPELRFWQALRAWAGVSFLLFADSIDWDTGIVDGWRDTFYFEGKEK